MTLMMMIVIILNTRLVLLAQARRKVSKEKVWSEERDLVICFPRSREVVIVIVMRVFAPA